MVGCGEDRPEKVKPKRVEEVDEFKNYAQNRFDTGSGWTYKSLERNIFINSSNTTAWFDEILINVKYGKFRGTGVLSKVDGMWKIDQYNLWCFTNFMLNQI